MKALKTFTAVVDGVCWQVSAGDVVDGGHPCLKVRPDLFGPSGPDVTPPLADTTAEAED